MAACGRTVTPRHIRFTVDCDSFPTSGALANIFHMMVAVRVDKPTTKCLSLAISWLELDILITTTRDNNRLQAGTCHKSSMNSVYIKVSRIGTFCSRWLLSFVEKLYFNGIRTVVNLWISRQSLFYIICLCSRSKTNKIIKLQIILLSNLIGQLVNGNGVFVCTIFANWTANTVVVYQTSSQGMICYACQSRPSTWPGSVILDRRA
jgi:hypothetical protein